MFTRTHPLNPSTHGLKHSHTPIPTLLLPMAQTQTPIPTPLLPMAPNTYTHPSPKPFHPWAQTLSHTHSYTPFT